MKDMLGNRLEQGDYVIQLTPKGGQRRILHVLDPDVLSTRNPGLDNIDYYYVRVHPVKIIEFDAAHRAVVRSPRDKVHFEFSSEEMAYEVTGSSLIKVYPGDIIE